MVIGFTLMSEHMMNLIRNCEGRHYFINGRMSIIASAFELHFVTRQQITYKEIINYEPVYEPSRYGSIARNCITTV